ncbi:MAG: hypothetical protein N2596_06120, partial [Syntrophorhabdaceae bacterium]|nr:hypothetical protein [Syntrophorhabdaceae bacterium]
ILLIKDFIKEYHPETLRLFFLSTHYRSPVDYNEKAIEDADSALYRLYHTLERADALLKEKTVKEEVFGEADELKHKFFEAMDDDFNTALALSYIFELSKGINRLIDIHDESSLSFVAYLRSTFLYLSNILGILNDSWDVYDEREKKRHLNKMGLELIELERLIEERIEARKKKDFKKADGIRNTLLEKGIVLQDTPNGTEWRVKK